MITPEEREEIINAAVERALLALPEVVGNLITSQFKLLKINKKFYEKFPEFSPHKDVISTIVEAVEAENPGEDYEKILEKALPIIRDRVSKVKSLDVKSIVRPNRSVPNLSDHGEL